MLECYYHWWNSIYTMCLLSFTAGYDTLCFSLPLLSALLYVIKLLTNAYDPHSHFFPPCPRVSPPTDQKTMARHRSVL